MYANSKEALLHNELLNIQEGDIGGGLNIDIDLSGTDRLVNQYAVFIKGIAGKPVWATQVMTSVDGINFYPLPTGTYSDGADDGVVIVGVDKFVTQYLRLQIQTLIFGISGCTGLDAYMIAT